MPFQSFFIQPRRFCYVAGNNQIRRDVFNDDRCDRGQAVFADAAKLVDAGKTAEYDIIINSDMAGQSGIISKNSMAADDTIMGDMNIGHYPVVVTNPGDTAAVSGPPVDGAILPDSVAVADFQNGFLFPMKLLILRVVTD